MIEEIKYQLYRIDDEDFVVSFIDRQVFPALRVKKRQLVFARERGVKIVKVNKRYYELDVDNAHAIIGYETPDNYWDYHGEASWEIANLRKELYVTRTVARYRKLQAKRLECKVHDYMNCLSEMIEIAVVSKTQTEEALDALFELKDIYDQLVARYEGRKS